MRQKIQNLLAHLNHGLIGRDATLKTALLTVLAGENIVLIGPPGTGKSLIARRIADSLGDAQQGGYFEYLLTKFSTPEEIFGPLSINALKQDVFRRNTNGYLPSVQLAFLDEIFKASSSILNALLTILNERIFHNGTEATRVPLQALIAASNELPTGQEELAALYDRFLVRSFVGYVNADGRERLLAAATAGEAPTAEPITPAEMQALQQAAQAVTLPPAIQQALLQIWREHEDAFKEDARESLSDRRLMKCLGLLRISAATNERTEVDLSDLLLLKDCLWNHPDNAAKVLELLIKVLRSHSISVPVGQPLLLADGGPTPSLTYEVGSDGSTLVPVRASPSRAVAPVVHASQGVGRMNAVVKGFCGSGTEQDPLLIQTADDLMDLARPEVGMQGYYFLQTADIDCSDSQTWMNIEFKGFFNGNEKNIIFNEESNFRYLFSVVHENSIIKNLTIKNWGIAGNVIGAEIHHCALLLNNKLKTDIYREFFEGLVGSLNESHIYSCSSDGVLVSDNSLKSTIKFCFSHSHIIQGTVEDCKIISCAANHTFFRSYVSNCEIQDCCLCYSNYYRNYFQNIIDDCRVDRLFFSGHALATFFRGGYIKDCVIGKYSSTSSICEQIISPIQLTNNYVIDTTFSNYYGNDKNGQGGQSIPSSRFNQRFFEGHTGWDFENVWRWDDETNQPALRYAGVDAYPPDLKQTQAPAAVIQDADMEDLLTRQVRANIWL